MDILNDSGRWTHVKGPVVLLAYVDMCSTVFHDVLDIMGLCVASWAGIVGIVIQLIPSPLSS